MTWNCLKCKKVVEADHYSFEYQGEQIKGICIDCYVEYCKWVDMQRATRVEQATKESTNQKGGER